MLRLERRHDESAYRIARLLDENLGEADHVGIVVQLLRKVDHGISRILLIAVSTSCEQGHESIL